MPPYITDISEIEQDGRYLEAYKKWYRQAFEQLIEADFRPWIGGGTIHGSLVYATSCAVRGELLTEAELAAQSIESLTNHVKKHPPENEAEAFIASCIEWTGDAYLFISPERSVIEYCEALDCFKSSTGSGSERWGMEAGYENSIDAISRYLDEIEYDSVNLSELSSIEYERRIESKLTLATGLLHDEYNTNC